MKSLYSIISRSDIFNLGYAKALMNGRNMCEKIDFVIPWVDGNDPKWQEEFAKHTPANKTLNTASRYKDWDNLQYIFRAFEEFTPWVNKIFFITSGHLPSWLNTDHPKLVIVKHTDYIPAEHLPTFSSHPIELNLHRIKELSEHFVYFNDDFFILKPLPPESFFKNYLPVDIAILDTLHDGLISHIILNDIDIINKNFNRHVDPNYSKVNIILSNFLKWFHPNYGLKIFQTLFLMRWKGHTGFVSNHHPQPYLKSTFQEVWAKEQERLLQTSASKFRDNQDVNQYLFRYWQLVTGKFTPSKYKEFVKKRKYVEVRTLGNAVNAARDIESQKYKMYCINDATAKGRYTKKDISDEDFEKSKFLIKEAFEKILPKKSSFER